MGAISPSFIPLLNLHGSTTLRFRSPTLKIPLHDRRACPQEGHFGFPLLVARSQKPCYSQLEDGDLQQHGGTIQILRVPDRWLVPSKASEESEWLRVALHKWLDDEYCPEPTNVEISKVAANSYYRSLLHQTTDLGEILLQMARELESISYQESFHGAFSSANAAVSLIAQRIELDEASDDAQG